MINLELGPDDYVRPCPFCGNSEPEMFNTHTAAYWIECGCGAEVHGMSYGSQLSSDKLKMHHHKRAAASAVSAWNRRVTK